MKKFKKVGLVAVLSMVIMLFTGCYHTMITSEIEITDKNGGGTRTYIAEILHNKNDVPKAAWMAEAAKKPFTPGNNFTTELEKGALKVGKDALQAKVKSYCKLDSATITVYEAKASVENTLKEGESTLPDTPSTYIKLSFSFTNIEDYNAKMKVLAGKYSDKITDAKLETVDGKLKFTEDTSNAGYGILEIIESIFGDKDVFDVETAGGCNSHSGAGFPDEDGFIMGGIASPSSMAQMKSASVKIGDSVYTEKFVDYEEGAVIYPENTYSLTGEIKEAQPPKEEGCGSSAGAAASIIGALGLIAFGMKKKIFAVKAK